MRLWHQKLIPHLPRQQLLGQHRECCALRGKGWYRKHSTVDYVFKYPYSVLFAYHKLVMEEMVNRGYSVTSHWLNHNYRGMLYGYNCAFFENTTLVNENGILYPEHNNDYLVECIENLKAKGVGIDGWKSLLS